MARRTLREPLAVPGGRAPSGTGRAAACASRRAPQGRPAGLLQVRASATHRAASVEASAAVPLRRVPRLGPRCCDRRVRLAAPGRTAAGAARS